MATDNENYINDDDVDTNNTGDDGYVEIYSKTAIWAFTIFFGVIFGGALLMQNLRDARYKKAGYHVIIFSIFFTIAGMIIGGFAGFGRYTSLIINITGGAILTEYFFKKYFPDNDYYPKPVWRALAISVIIVLALTLVVVYTPSLREQLQLELNPQ